MAWLRDVFPNILATRVTLWNISKSHFIYKKHGVYGTIRSDDQNHSQEKEMQESKVVVWEGLTKSWEKKRSERQMRKGKIYPLECRVSETSKER